MQTVLTVNPDGTVTGLYTEVIPLAEIGTMKIERLTEIEFNDSAQQWEVKARNGNVLFADPSRATCLAWEQNEFNQ